MTPSEKRLSISMQEGLAAVYTIRYFLSYLKYAHFYLITDHQALKYVLQSVEPRGMFVDRLPSYLL